MPTTPVPAAAPGLPISTRLDEITRAVNDAAVLGAVIEDHSAGPERDQLVQRQTELLDGAVAEIRCLFDLPRSPPVTRAQAQAVLALRGSEWGHEDGDWVEAVTRRVLENTAA